MHAQQLGRVASSVLLLAGLACSSSKLATSAPENIATQASTRAEAVFEPTDEEWKWFFDNHERTLDALMPLRSQRGAQRVLVAYRAVHTIGPGVLESYFAIDVGRGYGLYGATVVAPIDKSIGAQLLRLHRADPQASLETVLPLIKVQRLTTNDETCPGLLNWDDALHKVRVPMFRDPNVIHLDGMSHRIVVDGFIDVDDNNDDNPAARWAVRMLGTLTKCAQGK